MLFQVTCVKCQDKKMLLWPATQSTFGCSNSYCPQAGRVLLSDGSNRYNCFLCDLDLCSDCVVKLEDSGMVDKGRVNGGGSSGGGGAIETGDRLPLLSENEDRQGERRQQGNHGLPTNVQWVNECNLMGIMV